MKCIFRLLYIRRRVERLFMSDHNLVDDPLVSFDQPSPTKSKTNESYENRLLDDIDPFGNHNGTNGNSTNDSNQFSITNDLFPTDPDQADKGIGSSKRKIKSIKGIICI